MTTEKTLLPNAQQKSKKYHHAQQLLASWSNHPYLITCFSCDPDSPYDVIEMASLDSFGNSLHHIFTPKRCQRRSEKWFKRCSMTPLDFHQAVRWSYLQEDLFRLFNHTRYTYRLTDKASLLHAILHKRNKETPEAFTIPTFTNVMESFNQFTSTKNPIKKYLNTRGFSCLRPAYRCQMLHEFLQDSRSLQSPNNVHG